MDSSTYRHLFAQLCETCAIPHHYFPSHNIVSLDTLLEVSQNLNGDLLYDGAEFFSRFPCYQPFPYAVQKSSVLFCGSHVTDDATELVKNKMNWERKFKTLRIYNIESAMKQIKKLRQNKAIKLPKDVEEYVKHFHSDPFPNFSGNYNWLYTGGCLSYYEGPDGTTLIAGDFFNEQPGFHLLKLNEALNEIQFKSSVNLKARSPVLQIACKAKQENLIICARQRNFINFFSISEMYHDLYPVKMWRKKVVPPKFLTCLDLKADSEEIMITDSNHDLHIYNVERKEKVFGHSGKRIANDCNMSCWSQVAFEELGIYWAFKNCFLIVDQRDFSNSVKKLECMPTAATNNCEEICCFVKSPNDSNYVYLGTTHSILQMDLRNAKTIQRWTHLMKNPPQFMRAVKVEDQNEVLMLQSKNVDEISGIVNKYSKNDDKVNFLSTSLPYLFKSIKESFNLARFHGVCLSPFFARRVDFAVTGMHCLKNAQTDIILFTANSGGDIFQSQIKKKISGLCATEEDNQEVLNRMRMYEGHWGKVPLGNTSTKMTKKEHLELVDMRGILKGLHETRTKTTGAKKGLKSKKPEIYWPHREMYSLENLKLFKDVVAQKILRVWGYHSEESETDHDDVSVDRKVREWMDKC